MSEDALVDLNRAVQRIAHDAAGFDDARQRVDELLRRAVGYDIGSFATVDPATELWTSCYVSGLDATGSADRERTLYEIELTGDINTFAELSGRRIPAATLHAATGGALPRARRWAPLLEALDVVDEARAVLRHGPQTWGTLALYRAGTSHPFGRTELTMLTALLPDLSRLFRLMVIRLAFAPRPGTQAPPGGLTVLPDGTLTAISTSARSWLETLDDRGRLPAAIRSVAAAARARHLPAIVSIPSRRGGFVTLHGSAIEGSDGIAVVIETARPDVVSDVLAHAYQLTSRERQIAAETALGKTTRDTARALGISPFTVTDHLKSIYNKVGVNSRNELIATLRDQNPHLYDTAELLPGPKWYLDHNVTPQRARA